MAVIFLLVVLAFLGCLVAVPWGLALTVSGAVKRRRSLAVRGLALLCGALGVGGYVMGVALLLMAQSEASHGTGSSPAPACRSANPGSVAHQVGYFPLRFDCVLEDGTTRPAGVVLGWLTPASVALVAAGGGLSLDRRRKMAARRG